MTLTLKDMRKLAKSRGGKCLSRKYKGVLSKLKWMCKRKHVWEAKYRHIKDGHWCPVCAGRSELTVKEMQKIAEKERGKCLSKGYINHHTQIKWQCKEGHTWEAPYNYVKLGYWCPTCSESKPLRPNLDSEIIFKSLKKAYRNTGRYR